MAFKIGDKVIYNDKDWNGEFIKGEIVDIWKNSRDIVTNYFVTLDSGIYVQFNSDSPKWYKAVEPVLVA